MATGELIQIYESTFIPGEELATEPGWVGVYGIQRRSESIVCVFVHNFVYMCVCGKVCAGSFTCGWVLRHHASHLLRSCPWSICIVGHIRRWIQSHQRQVIGGRCVGSTTVRQEVVEVTLAVVVAVPHHVDKLHWLLFDGAVVLYPCM
jgi:hypothetical protein